MPAGCEFICPNINCLHYGSGFNMTSPWPMAKIEIILSNINTAIQKQNEYKEDLLRWKEEGRKHACLILPNEKRIDIEGYRVNMWDDTKRCIWTFEVFLEEGETLETATERSVPKISTDGNELKDFNKVLADGIKCPHCGEELKQSRWFSNNE